MASQASDGAGVCGGQNTKLENNVEDNGYGEYGEGPTRGQFGHSGFGMIDQGYGNNALGQNTFFDIRIVVTNVNCTPQGSMSTNKIYEKHESN